MGMTQVDGAALSGKVRCAHCGKTLGEFAAGLFVQHHRGRETVTFGVVSVRCDACGSLWRPRQLTAIDGRASAS